ncbi:hypothetical protein [Acinetobacter sp. NIPH 298]|uniref:hypothetical protein n=1 Tax=Acinetobacter sp. NIPH 298 TaxID=1217692 RepID=UPI0002D07816|nr:hypothetical protein [Acinetobacter sp. NIPH 298]ENW97038.1 hypothetical protein F903_00859 [Acinetobacter sp. NIPH 298]
MDSQEFVEKINKYIFDENLILYKKLFFNTRIEDVKDPYWKKAQSLFDSLPEENKEIFFEIIHQIMVDTTSNLFGVLDGTNDLGEGDYEFSLKNGDETFDACLQDYFLSYITENKK